LPNEPKKEPEFSLLEALVVLFLLAAFVLLLFVGGMYWS
jgi:hypothetical protein